MCNCNRSTNSLCSRCSKGLMCQCPPDYTIDPLPVDCGCCPPGYTWSTSTSPNWPNGVFTGSGGTQTAPIPCSPCEESLDARCVILPAITCFGIAAGTTLYDFISQYMCSDAFIKNILNRISLSSQLGTDFCELVSACPPPISGKTPIMGAITITYI